MLTRCKNGLGSSWATRRTSERSGWKWLSGVSRHTAGCYACDTGLGWDGIDRRRLRRQQPLPLNLMTMPSSSDCSAWSLQYCDVQRQKRPRQRRNFRPLFCTSAVKIACFIAANVERHTNQDERRVAAAVSVRSFLLVSQELEAKKERRPHKSLFLWKCNWQYNNLTKV